MTTEVAVETTGKFHVWLLIGSGIVASAQIGKAIISSSTLLDSRPLASVTSYAINGGDENDTRRRNGRHKRRFRFTAASREVCRDVGCIPAITDDSRRGHAPRRD